MYCLPSSLYGYACTKRQVILWLRMSFWKSAEETRLLQAPHAPRRLVLLIFGVVPNSPTPHACNRYARYKAPCLFSLRAIVVHYSHATHDLVCCCNLTLS